MEPRPENRITLTDDRDALDMPVPRVVHEMSQRDLESLHRLHEQIATDLETMGCGGELVGTPEELAKAEWGMLTITLAPPGWASTRNIP